MLAAAVVAAIVAVAAAVLTWVARGRRDLGSTSDRTTFRALHLANLASSGLRAGLTPQAADSSAHILRTLLGAPAVALTDLDRTLTWDGRSDHHRDGSHALSRHTIRDGTTTVETVDCGHAGCPLRQVIIAPLVRNDTLVGTLQVYVPAARAGLVRATNEVAGWVSRQLELAEVDASRARLVEAEMRVLRAQISPHFVYNSLSAIASFVRTDPERARELLLEFAEFARYSFRRQGDYTTLADELRSIERYLVLEKARFGDRLQVTLRIAPEALGVSLPFLSLQPLVENAVRHGLESKPTAGRLTVIAQDLGPDVVISVEDDGIGEDPETVRRALAGDSNADSIGLGNVDERLRNAFGPEYGLVIETAVGAGTKVIVRVPKFNAKVRPD